MGIAATEHGCHEQTHGTKQIDDCLFVPFVFEFFVRIRKP